MLYVYRSKYSEGAEELAYALTGAGVPARYIRKERELVPGRDRLICWGRAYPLPVPAGVPALNNLAPNSKFTDALKLKDAGVRTIEVSRGIPPARVTPLTFDVPGRANLSRDQLRDLIADLTVKVNLPDPPAATWIARTNDHIGGNDLLRGVQRPDYWSKKEDIRSEIRIHSFAGKSIRAGVKKVGGPHAANAHQWVRSYDGGWIIDYAGFSAQQAQRDLAASAVAALGLQFGAVDIGVLADGTSMVLEVNRAPGIEGNSTEAYVKAIQKWIGGH